MSQLERARDAIMGADLSHLKDAVECLEELEVNQLALTATLIPLKHAARPEDVYRGSLLLVLGTRSDGPQIVCEVMGV
ncbi:MAG: hypothetical protein AAGJ46_19405 [Planctomycetota bacterium]